MVSLRLRQFCPRGVPARLWRRGLWRWGDVTEGYWGGMLVFSSGLMVLLHLRPSTGGFRRALPEGVGFPGVRSLEWDYLRLNPLENSRWITQSRFKAVSTAGVSLWCCGCHEGVYGRSWGLSEALQRGGWGLFQPSGAGWVGCGRREHSLVWNQESGRGGGPIGGVVARSPVQNPGSESRFRIRPEPGAAAWWGDPPGFLAIRVVHSLSGP